MKSRKALAFIAIALVLALSLSGCGILSLLGADPADTMKVLVQGNLDEIYLGKYNSDFLELTDTTEEEAEQNYLDGLAVEADVYAQMCSIDYLTDELKAEIIDLYKEIYSHSKYEIGEVQKIDDDTYGVQLTVYPIDIMQQFLDASGAAADEFNAQYSEEEQELIYTDEDAYAAYDEAWARMTIELCRSLIPNIGYMEPVTMLVQVVRGDDDLWAINENDFNEIDLNIIYYPQ